MNSQPQTRRGCTCLCRNLTYQQLIEVPDDHLNCLLKKDIITLCQIYDIQYQSWQAKGELIKMIIEHRDKKNINIINLNNHPVYVYYKFYDDDYFICETVIYPEYNRIISASIKELEKIIVLNTGPQYMNIVIDSMSSLFDNSIYECNFNDADIEIILKPIEKNEWKKSTLKLNFLINELKRLGADKHDIYSSILDLHQDIEIPHHDEIDKENAGIPSVLTNAT